MCDAPAIRVEEWNGVQLDGAVLDVKSQTDVLRMEVNISVREHYALGIGARAAGIEKLGQRVFVDGSDVGAMRGGRLEKISVVAWRKPWPFWRAASWQNVLTSGISLRKDSTKPRNCFS